MSEEAIIGFRARISVNDGTEGAEAFFDGATEIEFPESEVGEIEDKRLYAATRDRKYIPTLIENGMVTVVVNWSKAVHARLRALRGLRGKTWKLYSPDEDGATVTLVPLIATVDGFLKKLGKPKFEKDKDATIAFDLRINSVTYANGTNDADMPTTAG
jgi:hypothetical protein